MYDLENTLADVEGDKEGGEITDLNAFVTLLHHLHLPRQELQI